MSCPRSWLSVDELFHSWHGEGEQAPLRRVDQTLLDQFLARHGQVRRATFPIAVANSATAGERPEPALAITRRRARWAGVARSHLDRESPSSTSRRAAATD